MEIKTFDTEVEYVNNINGEENALNVESAPDGTYDITLCEDLHGDYDQISIVNVTSDKLLSWCNLYILSEIKNVVHPVTIKDTEFNETTSTIAIDSEDMSEFCQTVIEHFNL